MTRIREVETVSADSKALDAFRMIIDKKVSGLGIVDSRGFLVGNVSASDLKDIGELF